MRDLAAGVPVDPDAETARQWLVAELSDPVYHERPNLLETFLEWLVARLDEMSQASSNLDAGTAALVVGGIVLVGAVVALVVAGPVARARRAARASVAVLDDDDRSAAELRAAADAHAAAGRWSQAVLDRFRALLRSLEDRVVLDPRPGRTAHEASEAAGRAFPSEEAALRRAGLLFDDICYGSAHATADDDAWLRGLDARLASLRPERPGDRTESSWSPPGGTTTSPAGTVTDADSPASTAERTR